MEKHHAHLIKIWAEDDALIVEFLTPGGKWIGSPNGPSFNPNVSYRLKDTDKSIISISQGLRKPVKEEEPEYNIIW